MDNTAMDNLQMRSRIEHLIADEHQLRRRQQDGETTTVGERTRLCAAEEHSTSAGTYSVNARPGPRQHRTPTVRRFDRSKRSRTTGNSS